MKEVIRERIASLRKFMKNKGLAAFIIPSSDPHSGEYVPERWKSREWISGFNGSAGTIVITLDKAGLWTDSRYWLAADEMLADTGIDLFKDRIPETPSITTWLGSVLTSGNTVGVDGEVNAVNMVESWRNELSYYGLKLNTDYDPMATLWENRPAIPDSKAFILSVKYAGLSAHEKLAQLRNALAERRAKGMLVTVLDEIAWLLNLRGDDVEYNPVLVSYMLITPSDATLFINSEKVTDEILRYLKNEGVQVRPYEEVYQALASCTEASILMQPDKCNYRAFSKLNRNCTVVRSDSPILYQKAIKNEIEIKGFHRAMVSEGVALVKFLYWLKNIVKEEKETEFSIDAKLTEYRAEDPLFQGLSFATIAGYKDHAAVVHYEATAESAYTLHPEGMLLLDCGGQYLDGTTDVTRTIILGKLSQEEKEDYTRVLKGFIDLSRVVFPKGTCGTQLDAFARLPLWEAGINYLNGTGHGVGHFLNVHEGPHQFRMNHMPAPLLPGMNITNEPGIYKGGRHGVRTENTTLIVPYMETEFGEFYGFEQLTLCPIDKEGIVPEMLGEQDIKWLNHYHEVVFSQLSPYLNSIYRDFLSKACEPL